LVNFDNSYITVFTATIFLLSELQDLGLWGMLQDHNQGYS